MKRLPITLAALAMFTVACAEQPATAPASSVMLSPGNGVQHRVSVGGHDADAIPGDKNFSLIALQHGDGSVTGQYIDMFGAGTNTGGYHVAVDCLVVVGNQAWIGGVVTKGDLNGVPVTGRRALTRVVNNGKSANDPPDQISYSYLTSVPCTARFPLPLLVMTDGQVTVN